MAAALLQTRVRRLLHAEQRLGTNYLSGFYLVNILLHAVAACSVIHTTGKLR